MKLGISTYTFGWAVGVPELDYPNRMTAPDLLNRAKKYGLSLVQFGDNLPLHELSEAQLQQLAQVSREQGIALEIGARGLTSDHLHRYIKLAGRLQARILRFVIDLAFYEPSVSMVVGILKEAAPYLQQQNVTLGLENHDRLKAREFRQIVEGVGSENVGICLDTVNSMGAAEGLETIVETLAPITVNLHIKDFGIERLPHKMGFQIDGRPAGQGMLNVPWLLEQVDRAGRCQTAILEQWVVPETSQAATLRKEEQWTDASVAYLKPFFAQSIAQTT